MSSLASLRRTPRTPPVHLLLLFSLALALAAPFFAVTAFAIPRVERFPLILRSNHLQPDAWFPDGSDILNTTDTATIVVYITQTGTTPATAVTATFQSQPGISFPAPTVSYGTLLPDAVSPRLIPVLTDHVDVGIYAIPTLIEFDGGASVTDTTWLSVWDLKGEILDSDLGQLHVAVTSPLTTLHGAITAPEVFVGERPIYFDVQSLRDTVDFIEPSPGVHWGDPLIAMTDTLVAAAPTSPSDNTVTICVIAKDSKGRRQVGAKVGVFYRDAAGDHAVGNCTTGADGTCCITSHLGAGEYGVIVLPPPGKEKLWGNGSRLFSPQKGALLGVAAIWPALPSGVVPIPLFPTAPPPNAQGGQNGCSKGLSKLVGLGWGAILEVYDEALLGPESAFLLVGASWYAAGEAASLIGEAADPDGCDVLWIAEENAPPSAPEELTTREILHTQLRFLDTPTFNGSSRVEVTSEFTRITDVTSYAWDHTDTITAGGRLQFDARPATRQRLMVRPRALPATALPGSAAIATAWITTSDSSRVLAQLVLHDDGAEPDSMANDGLHTAALCVFRTIVNTWIGPS